MTNQFNPKEGPDFETVEKEVIAAEDKFIPIMDHPIFEGLGKDNLDSIKDVVRSIQLLNPDEFVKAAVANHADFSEKERLEFFEERFKDLFITYIPVRSITQPSRIILNYEAFRRKPEELQFIFENIAKMIAKDTSYKGDPIDLNNYLYDPFWGRQLPPTSIETLIALATKMDATGINKDIYMLRQIGFGVQLLNKEDPHVEILDSALEDIRSDILRTLIEALIYGSPDAEANSLERLITGINSLELSILQLGPKLRPLYEREHFCIEFLLKYILKSNSAGLTVFNEKQAGVILEDLKELVGMLGNFKARDFTDFLAKHPIIEKAFSDMNYKYATIIWPREDGILGEDES